MSSVVVISAQWTTADILCCMRILSFHERRNHQKLLLISCICMKCQGDGGVGGKLNHYSSACCNTAGNTNLLEVKVPISSDTKWAATYLLLTAFCVGSLAFSVSKWSRCGSPLTTGEEEKGEFMKSSRLWPFTFKMTQPPSNRLKMWNSSLKIRKLLLKVGVGVKCGTATSEYKCIQHLCFHTFRGQNTSGRFRPVSRSDLTNYFTTNLPKYFATKTREEREDTAATC